MEYIDKATPGGYHIGASLEQLISLESNSPGYEYYILLLNVAFPDKAFV